MSKGIYSTLLCLALLVNSALTFAASPNAQSPFGVDLDVTDSDFCQKARYERETAMSQEPDLSKIDAVNTQDATMCFSPDENLYFVAVQEAQNIIGPHALWYIKIGEEARARAKEACKVMGYVNDEVSRAYDHCVENRYEELMGPYEDKYRREAGEYIRKRRQMAENLVVRCDAALSIKRSRLPREIRFPLAYYDKRISAVPSWFLEEKLGDEKWLERMSQLKANELMREVLGEECPGSMVYWVTYTAPKV